MNAKATVRFTLFGALLGLWFSANPLNAAELKDVRVGTYDTFTRVVFQFDRPVKFDKPIVQNQGAFTVIFRDVKTSLSAQSLKSKSKGLNSLKISSQAPHLKADVILPFSNIAIKAFALKGPDRVVVDVYETKPPPARITIKDVVIKDSKQKAPPAAKTAQTTTASVPSKAKAAAPPVKPAKPLPAKMKPVTKTQATKTTPVPTKPPKAIVRQQPQKQPTPKKKSAKVKVKKPKKTEKSFLNKDMQRYLTIALVVIGCAIVVLIGFMLIKKRRTPKPAVHSETEDLLESTEDVLTAIDDKIKEKLHKLK